MENVERRMKSTIHEVRGNPGEYGVPEPKENMFPYGQNNESC